MRSTGSTSRHAQQSYGAQPVTAKIIQVSCDAHSHRGWSMDYQGLPPVDAYLMCEPDAAVPLLLAAVTPRAASVPDVAPVQLPAARTDTVTLHGVAEALKAALGNIDFCVTRLPLGWNGAYLPFRHPLDYVGFDGGGGVGAGPGITVGAALALKGSGRIPIGLLGDGDFLMGNTAVWTAVHYQIPCLMIVWLTTARICNDERHQEQIALARGRPAENRWIGQRIDQPDIDIAAMARSARCACDRSGDRAPPSSGGRRARHRSGSDRRRVRDRCACFPLRCRVDARRNETKRRYCNGGIEAFCSRALAAFATALIVHDRRRRRNLSDQTDT